MSDPRGIMSVPEVGSAVSAAQRVTGLGRQDPQPEDEKEKKKKKPARPPEHDDGEPHVDLLA